MQLSRIRTFAPIRVLATLMLCVAVFATAGCQSRKVAEPAQAGEPPPPADPTLVELEAVEPEAPKTPRVGLLLPLTGPYAAIGTSMLQAAEMALFDTADPEFVLLPRDTGGTPAGAARAAQEVLDQDVGMIVGPLFAGSVEAVAPLARANGVRVVSFSTSLGAAGDGVYIMGFLSRDQIARAVEYAMANGAYRFGGLFPSSPFGQQMAAEFADSVQGGGGQLLRSDYFDPAAVDNSAVVKSFAAMPPPGPDLPAYDAVLVGAGGRALVGIVPLLPYYDIDQPPTRYLGTGQWDDPSLGREPSIVGGWYAAPDPAGRAPFEERYAAFFGQAPHRLSTIAYDATNLAGYLATLPEGPSFTDELLTRPDGYAGLDGLFRFLSDGRNERRLAVLEVRRGGPAVIAPAPAGFEVLTD